MIPDNGLGPPGNDDGRPEGPATTEQSPHRRTSDSTAAVRQCRYNAPVGRRASVFREGFRRGALDALRVAHREINDPAVWVVLSRLADRYDRDPDDLPGVDQ